LISAATDGRISRLPTEQRFRLRFTSDNSVFGFPFGFSGDQFAPGDYDGDGRTDLAVYRNSAGVFFVQRSSDNTVIGVQFGLQGDEPVARDYDGDGRTDFAVVRRTGGGARLVYPEQLEQHDHRRAIRTGYRPRCAGRLRRRRQIRLSRFSRLVRPARDVSSCSAVRAVSPPRSSASAATRVVPGDYDGDGRTDFAVVRTGTTFEWYILRSSDNTVQFDRLGAKSFFPVQNDYDGDGRTDVAVYDPNTNFFYIRRSSNGGLTQIKFGQPGDIPIAIYDTH
jgi:hypothetical protein